MTRLTSVHVERFRSLREATVKLEPVNVLIGPNGAGKTNLIMFFRLLATALDGTLKRFVSRNGGGQCLLYGGAKVSEEIFVHLGFETPKGIGRYNLRLRFAADDQLAPEREEPLITDTVEGFARYSGVIAGAPVAQFEIASNAPNALAAQMPLSNSAQKHVQVFLEGVQAFHFEDTSMEGPLRKRSLLDDTLRLRADGGNLPAYLLHLRETAHEDYLRIRSTLQLVVPTFEDFILEREGNSILLRCRMAGHTDYPIHVSQLSDGTLRLIALITLLRQPAGRRPRMMVIDEPELGLHPAAEAAVASLIRAAAEEGTQMLVATQSATFLSHFEPDEVVVVENEAGGSTFRRYSRNELAGWLERYSLGQIWLKNLIGGRP